MGEESIDCPNCNSKEIQKEEPFEYPPPTEKTWIIRRLLFYNVLLAFLFMIVYLAVSFLSYWIGSQELIQLFDSQRLLISSVFLILISISITGYVLIFRKRKRVIVCECLNCGFIFEFHSNTFPIFPRTFVTWENGEKIIKRLD